MTKKAKKTKIKRKVKKPSTRGKRKSVVKRKVKKPAVSQDTEASERAHRDDNSIQESNERNQAAATTAMLGSV